MNLKRALRMLTGSLLSLMHHINTRNESDGNKKIINKKLLRR